jgi:hypothetical protein
MRLRTSDPLAEGSQRAQSGPRRPCVLVTLGWMASLGCAMRRLRLCLLALLSALGLSAGPAYSMTTISKYTFVGLRSDLVCPEGPTPGYGIGVLTLRHRRAHARKLYSRGAPQAHARLSPPQGSPTHWRGVLRSSAEYRISLSGIPMGPRMSRRSPRAVS